MYSRQITRESATNFGLGFAPDSWHALTTAMKAEGFTESELLDAGLAKKSKTGEIYDAFRNRLIFPIMDAHGNVTAFSGRILGNGEPKYLNTAATQVFDKAKNLFGINLAKKLKA